MRGRLQETAQDLPSEILKNRASVAAIPPDDSSRQPTSGTTAVAGDLTAPTLTSNKTLSLLHKHQESFLRESLLFCSARNLSGNILRSCSLISADRGVFLWSRFGEEKNTISNQEGDVVPRREPGNIKYILHLPVSLHPFVFLGYQANIELNQVHPSPGRAMSSANIS